MDAWPIYLMSALSLGFLAWVVSLVWRLVRSVFVPVRGKEFVCLDCGSRARSVQVTQGSTTIELILWVCLIVPGLIYSVWRLTTRKWACPVCGGHHLVPPDSPVGRRTLRDAKT